VTLDQPAPSYVVRLFFQDCQGFVPKLGDRVSCRFVHYCARNVMLLPSQRGQVYQLDVVKREYYKIEADGSLSFRGKLWKKLKSIWHE